MLRSRSSFEDLAGAIASASSLEPVKPGAPPVFRGAPLVSFGGEGAPEATPITRFPPEPGPITRFPPEPEGPTRSSPPRSPDAGALDDALLDTARRPPKLPDLSDVTSPLVRCEKIVAWIVEATGAGDVFLADASGLPLAGSFVDAEARLASAGVVASAALQLAASLPGNTASAFELHLGEGPFFQLIGFEATSALYLVGFTRSSPLTPRQVHAVRLACRHALGEVSEVA